jgi:hypothetical protein
MAIPNAARRPPPPPALPVTLSKRWASARAGTRRPSAPKARIEPTLSSVRAFCTQAPSFKPRWLIPVSSRIASAAATWPPLTVQLQPPTGTVSSTFPVENQGRKLPRYSPNATPRAAIPPDMMTRKAVQP